MPAFSGHLSLLVRDAVAVVVRVRAPVVVLEPVLVLGLAGALVLVVQDAVPVLVLHRAAPGAQRARLVRAGVHAVRDAVPVIVQVGAAVLVLEPVLVLRLVRAPVLVVGDAVPVAVLRRAAPQLHRAGLVGALVQLVRHPVFVVVQLGAAVVVLEHVLVLDLAGALVLVVGDAVPVLVLHRAAAGLQRPRLVGALVLGVEHAVAVVVQLRAPVVILEGVLVLRLVRAPVLVVGDAVPVLVQRHRHRAALVGEERALLVGTAVVGVQHVVAVVVRVGAAVLVLEPVLVLRLVRAGVVLVGQSVVVPVDDLDLHHHRRRLHRRRFVPFLLPDEDLLRRAAARQLQRLLDVVLRHPDVVQGAEVVAAVQLAHREVAVGHRVGQLARGALDRPGALGPLDVVGDDLGVRADLAPGDAGAAQEDRGEDAGAKRAHCWGLSGGAPSAGAVLKDGATSVLAAAAIDSSLAARADSEAFWAKPTPTS